MGRWRESGRSDRLPTLAISRRWNCAADAPDDTDAADATDDDAYMPLPVP